MNKAPKILAPILVLAAGAGATALLISLRPEPEKVEIERAIPVVEVVSARARDHRFAVAAHGTVLPRTSSELVAEVEGRVIEVSPSLVNGGFFEEGELLLKIDPQDYQLARAQATLEVARAERRLAEEEADAAVAREEWTALGRGEATPLVLREPQVAEAKAALAAARAQLDRAERDLSRTEVRAVFAGRVREKMADLGQFVTRGKSLARVYAVDYAEVRLPLPDSELAFIDLPLVYRGEHEGPREPNVELSVDFGGRRHTWPATIVRTEGEIDPRTRMVVAVARVEDPYGRSDQLDRPPLAVGMFVDATIAGRELEDVFVLPREALRGEARVFLVDDGGRLRFRDVDVLRADRNEVVVGHGLESGEQVVVSPLEVVTDGTPVKVQPSAARSGARAPQADTAAE